MLSEHTLREIASTLRSAKRVAVMTGAGTSAESGIPTFRDAQTGLWARFRAQELATPEAFREHPGRVWDWYQWRRETVRAAKPNAAHYALARMASMFTRFDLITQNVDGLHQQAGSEDVIELHGNILRSICHITRKPIDSITTEHSPAPSGHHPRGLARPDVVWFGEALPVGELTRAADAARACDAFFSVGTSSMVEPAASLAHLAAERGALVVEINPEPTPLSATADHVLRQAATVALPALLDELKKGDSPAGRVRRPV